MRAVLGTPGHRAAVRVALRRGGCRLSTSRIPRFVETVWTAHRPNLFSRDIRNRNRTALTIVIPMAWLSSARRLIIGATSLALVTLLSFRRQLLASHATIRPAVARYRPKFARPCAALARVLPSTD